MREGGGGGWGRKRLALRPYERREQRDRFGRATIRAAQTALVRSFFIWGRRVALFFFASWMPQKKKGRNNCHYRNMSVVPTVRRPSPTVGVGTAIGEYSRRSIGTTDIFLSRGARKDTEATSQLFCKALAAHQLDCNAGANVAHLFLRKIKVLASRQALGVAADKDAAVVPVALLGGTASRKSVATGVRHASEIRKTQTYLAIACAQGRSAPSEPLPAMSFVP